jgi:hypothetical protein
MSSKQTLDEVFAKAGLQRQAVPDRVRAAADAAHRRGKLKAYRFACLYVKHNFNATEAYKEFIAYLKRPMPSSKQWAYYYSQSELVCHFAREIIQEAVEQVKEQARDDINEMLKGLRALVDGDLCDLLTQTREYQLDGKGEQTGTFRLRTHLKSLSELTKRDRMLLQEIRFRNGEVVGIKAYSRLDAMRQLVVLLELIHRQGGSDKDWMGDFKSRITAARQKRIDIEVAAGKVIRLPVKTGTTDL